MTTEIDAEGLAAAAEAIDTLWSDGQDRGPAFADTEREYQEHCRSTARAAITAYLATTRTSEAEPVADPSFANALRDSEVRIWINTCNHEPARQALRQLLAYRVRGVSQPLRPTPASDDQVEAAYAAGVEAAAKWHESEAERIRLLALDSDNPGRMHTAQDDHISHAAFIRDLAAMGSTKPAPRLDATVRGEEG